jgi:hypothetical protein
MADLPEFRSDRPPPQSQQLPQTPCTAYQPLSTSDVDPAYTAGPTLMDLPVELLLAIIEFVHQPIEESSDIFSNLASLSGVNQLFRELAEGYLYEKYALRWSPSRFRRPPGPSTASTLPEDWDRESGHCCKGPQTRVLARSQPVKFLFRSRRLPVPE